MHRSTCGVNDQTKQATKTKRATQLEDAPMYKVILIGDEEYNREHVVMSIQDIVPDTDNTRVRCGLLDPYPLTREVYYSEGGL